MPDDEQLQWMLKVEDEMSRPLTALSSTVTKFLNEMDHAIVQTDSETEKFSDTMNDLTFGTAPKLEEAFTEIAESNKLWRDNMEATISSQHTMAQTMDMIAQGIAELIMTTRKGSKEVAEETEKAGDSAKKSAQSFDMFTQSLAKGQKGAKRFIFSLEEVGVTFGDIAKIVAGITAAGLIVGFFKKISEAQEYAFERMQAWNDELISMPAASRSAVRSIASLEYHLGATNDELAELGAAIGNYHDLTKVTKESGAEMRLMAQRSLQVSRAMNISSTSAWQLLSRLSDMNKLGPEAAVGVTQAFDHVAKATSLSGEEVAEIGGNIATQMTFLRNNLEDTMGEGAKRASQVAITEMTAIGGAVAKEFGEGIDLSAWLESLKDRNTRRQMFAAVGRIAGVAPEALEDQFKRGDVSGIFLQMVRGAKVKRSDLKEIDRFREFFGKMSEQIGLDANQMEQLIRLNVEDTQTIMADAVTAMDAPARKQAGKATMSAWEAAWKKFEHTIARFYNKVGAPFMELFIDGFQWGIKQLQPPLMKFAKTITDLELDEKLTKWWKQPEGGKAMFASFKMSIVDDIIPAIKWLGKKIGELRDWYRSLSDDNKTLVKRIALVTGAFILLADTIVGKVIVAMISMAWTLTKKVITSLFRLAWTITTVAVKALVTMAWEMTKRMVPALIVFAWNVAKTAIPALLTFVGTVLASVIPALIGMAASLLTLNIPAFISFAGFLVSMVVPALFSLVGTIIAGALPAIGALALAFGGALLAALPFIAAIGALAYLGYTIYDSWSDIELIFGGWFASIKKWLDQTFPRLSKFLGWITGSGEKLTEAGMEDRVQQQAPPKRRGPEEGLLSRLTGEDGIMSGIMGKLGINIPTMPAGGAPGMPAMPAGMPAVAMPAVPLSPGGEPAPVEIDDNRIVDILDTIKNVLLTGFAENAEALNRRGRRASADNAMIATLAPAE
jgi:hypothetical protein